MEAHGIEGFGGAVTLAVVGFGIVFGVLALTATLVWLVRRVDAQWQRREQVVEQQRLDRDPTIDATTAVLIAAAVSTYLGGRARVRSVRRLIPAEGGTSAWSAQGRSTLLGSHAITGRSGVHRRS